MKNRACEPANEYTCRPAALLLSAEIGDKVSHGSVWSWVQKGRKALRKEEERRREAVFEDGEVFCERLYLKGEEKLALSEAWNNSRH